jgi:integrase
VRVGGGRGLLSELKADPGRLGLETLLGEIAKLERIRAPACRATCSAAQYPSDLRAASPALRHTFATRMVRGGTDLVVVAELLAPCAPRDDARLHAANPRRRR